MRSFAAPNPHRWGRNDDDASSGTRPIFTNRTLSLALSATTMRSNGRIIVRPTPIAGPFTAATIGFVDRMSSTQSRVRAGGARPSTIVAGQLRVEHRGDVGARAEPAARAGDHEGAHGGVGVGRFDRVDELGAHARRPRVELVGTVQGEQHDVVALLAEDLLVVHGADAISVADRGAPGPARTPSGTSKA